jgi:hypothetical protein
MQPGKIRLRNTGAEHPENYVQTLAQSVGNRVYRVTNDGPANGGPSTMRLRITRSVFFWTVDSVFDLPTGRSVDVYCTTLTATALDTLEQNGTFDTVDG